MQRYTTFFIVVGETYLVQPLAVTPNKFN